MCEILRLDVQKEKISIVFTLCYKNVCFECFLTKKKGFGILGVAIGCLFVCLFD